MTPAAPSGPSSLAAWRAALKEYGGLLLVLGALLLIFWLLTERFFSHTNLMSIANQIPAAMLVATGMTLVLLMGEIDLSVGSVLALCGVMLGMGVMQWGLPVPLAIGAALVAGLLCGLFNGWVSLRWRLPSFIVTLGMLEIARGGCHALAKSNTVYVGSKLGWIAETSVVGFSMPFLLALGIVVGSQVALTRTVFGRYLVAIGTNLEAVRLSGIRPHPLKLAVFMAASGLASLAAVIEVSRLGSANPNAGTGFELQAIAAAVIGGTSLLGGRGSVFGTFLGVLIIAVLDAGLASLGARDEVKRLITGLVIVLAVVIDYYRHRLSRRSKYG